MAPCFYIPWCSQFTFDRNSEFSLREETPKHLISLNKLIENFNSDNLYSKPRCLLNSVGRVTYARIGPHRKHRSSIAIPNVACAAVSADSAENIPLLLFAGLCLVTVFI
jgi:hypothetical protein